MIKLRDHLVTLEPIDTWPYKPTHWRDSAPFRASLDNTQQLLNRELSMLSARDVILQMAVRREDFRVDGNLRSGAKIRNSGVILRFMAGKRPYAYPCDNFEKWEDNLRAIALALEALRKVSRYRVGQGNEQYSGWLALPKPETIETEIPDATAARAWLANFLGLAHWPNGMPAQDLLRQAELRSHPDRNGNVDAFKRVQRCRQLLV